MTSVCIIRRGATILRQSLVHRESKFAVILCAVVSESIARSSVAPGMYDFAPARSRVRVDDGDRSLAPSA